MSEPLLPTTNVPLLPLFGRVIFVDWHGVLSNDVFWSSILDKPTHPLHEDLTRATGALFSGQQEYVRDWMRGKLATEDIIKNCAVRLDRRFRPDFLFRRLQRDCRQMAVNTFLVEALRTVYHDTYIVLATDNITLFPIAARSNPALCGIIDSVICSATAGVLKTDSIVEFFGPWLEAHSLSFADALLLDDNATTCSNFCAHGGSAIHVKCLNSVATELKSWRKS